MKLYSCSSCHQHFMGKTCAHCDSASMPTTPTTPTMPKMIGLALILGLGLPACGKDEDSGEDSGEETAEPEEEPASEPDVAALYGAEEAD